MFQIQWKGFDLGEIEYAVAALLDEIELDVRQIIEDIVDEALEDMVRILEAAETETGRRRAAERGGHPGRVDTAQMSADIRYALETSADGAVVGTWGWTQNVEDYYLIQEYGSEKIGAMSALQGSYVRARERLRQRLQDIGLEVS